MDSNGKGVQYEAEFKIFLRAITLIWGALGWIATAAVTSLKKAIYFFALSCWCDRVHCTRQKQSDLARTAW
jgi:hypothetical protein